MNSAIPPFFAPVYAGFIRRFLAFAIDGVIIAIFLYCTARGMLAAGGFAGADGWQYLRFGVAMAFFSAVFPFVYFIYFHAMGGQTPGKKALGIRVVEQGGGEAGPVRSVFRAAGYLVSTMFFMLGFLWPVFDRRAQAWHDKIAGTVVVEG